MNTISQRSFQLLMLAVVLLNATALFNDILEPDGALYAAIAKHIALTGDWVNLYGDGHDWLDKPHLPFWLAALSFKCLGVSAFAYKLPAFLCWALGLYYTHALARRLYGWVSAQLAVIIYGTALHVVLANFDVRAEAYLTTFVIAAIYYLYEPEEWHVYWRKLLVGAFFCALAVMTKGVFVLIPITAGLVVFQLTTYHQQRWFTWHWWLVMLAILIGITPEIYCLYKQFDSHPEKVVFGQTHVSGIRFFFWDSQFGRFFNNGPIRGQGDVFFFLHTLLWAFLPWSLFLYAGVFQLLRRRIIFIPRHWVVAGSALAGFLLFSFSKFQLPHYIIIVFPQLAMLTANWLMTLRLQGLRKITIVQQALTGTGAALLLALSFISHIGNLPWQLSWLVLAVTVILLFLKKADIQQVAARGTGFAVMLFVFLNLLFYPALLQYQGGMQAGKYVHKQPVQGRALMFQCNVYSFEFYAPQLVGRAEDSAALYRYCAADTSPVYVLAPADAVAHMQHPLLQTEALPVFSNFHVSQLTAGFIQPQTRAQQLNTYCLLRVYARR